MTTRHLNQGELEVVVGWFLNRASADERTELMADLPQLYSKLFPGVNVNVIAASVRDKLNRLAGERAEKNKGCAATQAYGATGCT
jgi:hypothetical protein